MTYRLKFLLSYAALLYERIWSTFWPAFALVAAYTGLSLLNAVTLFGPRMHAALLAAAVLGAVMALARPFRFPRPAEVERRMEAAGALAHRPLAALHDKPAGKPAPDALALWNSHVARMATMKAGLKIHIPRPDVARQDRFALRHAALILLIVGLAVAGKDSGARLDHALRPAIAPDLGLAQAALDVWAAPPDYMRLPPVFLASSQPGVALAGETPALPAGSLIKLRVDGSARAPHLRFAGQPHDFTRASERSWIATLTLNESGVLRVRQGVRELGAWTITTLPDTPPDVRIVRADPAGRGMTKITYTARDDYGVTKMSGTVTPPEPLPPEQGGRVVIFDMTPPPPDKTEHTFTVDLSSNIRAGEEAQLALTAVDGGGHEVTTPPFTFTLPERHFNNPLAQKVVGERKKLAAAKDTPARRAVAEALSDLGQDTAAYKNDSVIFLSLGSAVRRLVYDGRAEAVLTVEDLLWDVALKIEDGGLSVAARDLAEALQQLQKSLGDKSTPKAELQQQMDELQHKMQAYLQQLATELSQRLKDGKGGAPLPQELAKKFMQNIDLGEMMRQMQQLARGGSREEMEKMAEFLKNAVQNLSLEKLGQTTPEQAQAMQALSDLQDAIKRQQALMDKTGRLDPEDKGVEEKKEQDALREKLGDIARKLGEGIKDVPDNIARADRAMKDAQGALGDGKPRDSLPHQKTALDEMQKGLDGAVKKMAQQMKQTMLSLGFAPGGESDGTGAGFDPLGRSGDDPNGKQGGDIRIPDAAERRRVQEIIDELRHRSNDYQRPKVERDYLDRLLDQMN